jgi:serine protease Do
VGYYDQDYEHLQKKQKGNRGWFLSALTGAILGALLIVFSLPALANWNVLPYNIEEKAAEDGDQEKQADTPKYEKNVSVNVVSQVTEAVDKVSDAVVGVVNLQNSSFWDQEAQEAGTGSGVIYKKDGNSAFIVTNHHVIEGASGVEVSLSDGTRVPAKVLGSDIWTDLAVLQIDSKHVKTVAEFGDSDAVKPGEPVIAIGNPLGLQFSGSVTQGIISGKKRSIPMDLNNDGVVDWNAEVLQTDAAINPGNSGGALVNIDGKVIGINSMKIAQQAVEGIGLAIPINDAIPIIDKLEKYGEVRRPYMGVDTRSLADISTYHLQQTLHLPPNVTEGVAILEVVPLSPADKAGLKQYDVIVALDGEKISDVIELRRYLFTKKSIGDKMEVTFYRDGKKQKTTIKLTDQSMQ